MLTGLPDAYGRGRIIGDYRRVALYGIDFLMKDKFAQFNSLQAKLESGEDTEATIRLREEIAEQHRALGQIKEMAAKYGYDISGPATTAQEAIQWTYFGYGCREISERRGNVLRSYLQLRISTSSVTCRRVKSPSKTHRKWLTTGHETAYGSLPAYPGI